MIEPWTEEDKQQVRYGIFRLILDEIENKQLNQEQLQAIFYILALKAPTKYRHYEMNNSSNEEERKWRIIDHDMSGWFVEEHI